MSCLLCQTLTCLAKPFLANACLPCVALASLARPGPAEPVALCDMQLVDCGEHFREFLQLAVLVTEDG